MTIFDLIFAVCFLGSIVALVRLCYLLVRRRYESAKRTALRLLAFLGLYALVLMLVAVASPQKVLSMGEPQCFDDWCITVVAATQQQSIGETRAHGVFYVVTARVSSRAKQRRQRETDVYVYMTDGKGRRYEVSPEGQSALERAGLAGEPLTTFVDAGEAFESRLAFDVPADAASLGFVKTSHGWFPGMLIIGSAQILGHDPTVRLVATSPGS